MRFRKRPVEVEAFQMTQARRESNLEWPEWLNKAWQKDREEEGSLSPVDYPNSDGKDQLQIRTLEGVYLVGWRDWIVRGIKGEIYPCKPDIFEVTYDLVSAPVPSVFPTPLQWESLLTLFLSWEEEGKGKEKPRGALTEAKWMSYKTGLLHCASQVRVAMADPCDAPPVYTHGVGPVGYDGELGPEGKGPEGKGPGVRAAGDLEKKDSRDMEGNVPQVIKEGT